MHYRTDFSVVIALSIALTACGRLGGLSNEQAATDLSASIKTGFCSKLYIVGDVTVLDRASVTIPGDTSPLTKVEAQVTLSSTPAFNHMGMFDECVGAVMGGSLQALKPLANGPTATARVQGYWRKWQSGWRLESWNFE